MYIYKLGHVWWNRQRDKQIIPQSFFYFGFKSNILHLVYWSIENVFNKYKFFVLHLNLIIIPIQIDQHSVAFLTIRTLWQTSIFSLRKAIIRGSTGAICFEKITQTANECMKINKDIVTLLFVPIFINSILWTLIKSKNVENDSF